MHINLCIFTICLSLSVCLSVGYCLWLCFSSFYIRILEAGLKGKT